MFNRFLSLGILAASLAVTGTTSADVVEESFEGAQFNRVIWHPRRMMISPGLQGRMKMIRIDGKLTFKGKGGGAGCVLRRPIDWNDSFRTSLKISVGEAPAVNGTTRVGVGFVLGSLGSIGSLVGVPNGVRLEIRSTGSQSVIQFVARRAGQDVQVSDAVAIAPGAHAIDLYWFADGTDKQLDIRAYLDGDLTKPAVQLQAFPETFSNGEGSDPSCALRHRTAWFNPQRCHRRFHIFGRLPRRQRPERHALERQGSDRRG